MKSENAGQIPASYKILLALIAVAGIVLVILTTGRYGAGVSPDSVVFISTARNITAGKGLIDSHGTPLVGWPPLYPILLALTSAVSGIDPLVFINVFNAVIFGLVIYSGGILTFVYFPDLPGLSVITAAAILASVPLFGVMVMAWSEPLFILIILLSLIAAKHYLTKRDGPSLLLFSILLAFAPLIRYIGIILIPWGILVVLTNSKTDTKKKFDHVLVLCLISILPIALWANRNLLISGTFFGLRAVSIYTLDKNLSFVFNSFLRWYVPAGLVNHRAVLMFFSLIFGFFVGLSFKRELNRKTIVKIILNPLILLILIYLSFLVFISTTSAMDGIGDRLLSPIYVPLIITVFYAVYSIICDLVGNYQGGVYRKAANVSLVALFVLWVVFPIEENILSEARRLSSGVGYTGESWNSSPLIQYLKQNQAYVRRYAVYSNQPDLVYILTGLVTQLSPVKTRFNSPEVVSEISNLEGYWPVEGDARLIWFDSNVHPFLFSIEELKKSADFRIVTVFTDGVIYAVQRR